LGPAFELKPLEISLKSQLLDAFGKGIFNPQFIIPTVRTVIVIVSVLLQLYFLLMILMIASLA
jgi:hypothetical protein